MEPARLAPLVLRLSRHRLRQRQSAILCTKALSSKSLSHSACHRAASLPPSLETPASKGPTKGSTTQQDPLVEASSSSSSAPPPPLPRRSLRPFIWATGFVLIGVTINAVMRAIVFPPPLPEPDSEEDAQLVSRIKSDLNDLPIIAELRKDREVWREYDPYSQREAFALGSSQEDAEVDSHLTAGTLRGARGLAVQRSFYNAAEKREISVIFFGGAVSGWPGVTHGGVLMTILKEAIERAANGPSFARRPEDSEAPLLTQDGIGEARKRQECESLTLEYKRPTRANYFYVIRAEVQDVDPAQPGHTHVKASLEDALTAKVGVYASGYCKRGGVVGTAKSAVSHSTGSLWRSVSSLFSSTA